jgi:hypothetical protein
MRKSFLFISTLLFAFVAFFVIGIWNTISRNPNTQYGHLLLLDKA